MDALGRTTKSYEWLERAGFGRVERQNVVSNMAYVSALFEGVKFDQGRKVAMVRCKLY